MIRYVTEIEDINTDNGFYYLVSNENVYSEWILWQKENPGPYKFLIKPV